MWVKATVEKLIRSNGSIDYLVLDVLSVLQNAPTSESETRTESRSSGRQRSCPMNMMGVEPETGSLDAIAEDLVGEVELEQRTNRGDGTIVTDKTSCTKRVKLCQSAVSSSIFLPTPSSDKN